MGKTCGQRRPGSAYADLSLRRPNEASTDPWLFIDESLMALMKYNGCVGGPEEPLDIHTRIPGSLALVTDK